MTAYTRICHAHVIKRARRHRPRLIAFVMTAIAGGKRGDVCLGSARCMHAVVASRTFFWRANKHIVVMATITSNQHMRADQRKTGGKVVERLAIGKDVVRQRRRVRHKRRYEH